jgi:hypothetical protein
MEKTNTAGKKAGANRHNSEKDKKLRTNRRQASRPTPSP